MFKNWKTTIAGLLPIVAIILKAFGVNIAPEVLATIAAGAVALIGLFAKDFNVTGNTDTVGGATAAPIVKP